MIVVCFVYVTQARRGSSADATCATVGGLPSRWSSLIVHFMISKKSSQMKL